MRVLDTAVELSLVSSILVNAEAMTSHQPPNNNVKESLRGKVLKERFPDSGD
jgi:hypothetical protein